MRAAEAAKPTCRIVLCVVARGKSISPAIAKATGKQPYGPQTSNEQNVPDLPSPLSPRQGYRLKLAASFPILAEAWKIFPTEIPTGSW
jgi:hypothetical protein